MIVPMLLRRRQGCYVLRRYVLRYWGQCTSCDIDTKATARALLRSLWHLNESIVGGPSDEIRKGAGT